MNSSNGKKRKMPTKPLKCCVPTCNGTKDDPDVHFHRIPPNHTMRHKWAKLITGKKNASLPHGENIRICSKHFTLDSYKSTAEKGGRWLLHENACPTIDIANENVNDTLGKRSRSESPSAPSPKQSKMNRRRYQISDLAQMEKNNLVQLFSQCLNDPSIPYNIYRCKLLGKRCFHTFAGIKEDDCCLEMGYHLLFHIKELQAKARKNPKYFEKKFYYPFNEHDSNKNAPEFTEVDNLVSKVEKPVLTPFESEIIEYNENGSGKSEMLSAMGLAPAGQPIKKPGKARIHTRNSLRIKMAHTNARLDGDEGLNKDGDSLYKSNTSTTTNDTTPNQGRKYNFRKVMNKHIKSTSRVDYNTLYNEFDYDKSVIEEANSKLVELPLNKQNEFDENAQIMPVSPTLTMEEQNNQTPKQANKKLSQLVGTAGVINRGRGRGKGGGRGRGRKRRRRRLMLNTTRDKLLGDKFQTKSLKSVIPRFPTEEEKTDPESDIAVDDQPALDDSDNKIEMELNKAEEVEEDDEDEPWFEPRKHPLISETEILIVKAINHDHNYLGSTVRNKKNEVATEIEDDCCATYIPTYSDLLRQVQEVKADKDITREVAKERLKAIQILMQLETLPKEGVFECPPYLKKLNSYYVCNICHKHLNGLQMLQNHLRGHAGIKPFHCTLCGRTFTRLYSLNYHISVHKNTTRFKCEFCGRGFRHPSHFREHQNSHTGDEPYECIVCKRTYKTSNTHRRHMKVKHSMSANRERLGYNAQISPITVKMDQKIGVPTLLIQSYPDRAADEDHPIFASLRMPLKVKIMPVDKYYEMTLREVPKPKKQNVPTVYHIPTTRKQPKSNDNSHTHMYRVMKSVLEEPLDESMENSNETPATFSCFTGYNSSNSLLLALSKLTTPKESSLSKSDQDDSLSRDCATPKAQHIATPKAQDDAGPISQNLTDPSNSDFTQTESMLKKLKDLNPMNDPDDSKNTATDDNESALEIDENSQSNELTDAKSECVLEHTNSVQNHSDDSPSVKNSILRDVTTPYSNFLTMDSNEVIPHDTNE